MTTCSVLNSSGTAFSVSNTVLESDGNPFIVGGTVLDSDGNAFVVCVVVEDEQIHAGGEDPRAKRRRYRHIAAQREDKLIIAAIKAYVQRVH
ncbi:MAG: hypothetical protein KOO63_08175 [Bacteroidales bacterium]|nr:hypothetical protein [Candidatus Latescibacterota bacterium]